MPVPALIPIASAAVVVSSPQIITGVMTAAATNLVIRHSYRVGKNLAGIAFSNATAAVVEELQSLNTKVDLISKDNNDKGLAQIVSEKECGESGDRTLEVNIIPPTETQDYSNQWEWR